MSRVNDALHRELNRDVAGEPELRRADSLSLLDVARTLADEPFPLEAPLGRTAPARQLAPATDGGAGDRQPPLIARLNPSLAQKVVIDREMMPLSREQYRRLAASLHHLHGTTGLKVVMISSGVPGEGKTLTAANLALTFSESYQRTVLLIDADLRRPSQHHLFQIENSAGLSDGLSAVAGPPLKVRQVSERLALLPAGESLSDPMAGLTSPRMQRVIAEAREMFDWVIIDTPPLGLLPDAKLLGTFVDGAVLVIKAGS